MGTTSTRLAVLEAQQRRRTASQALDELMAALPKMGVAGASRTEAGETLADAYAALGHPAMAAAVPRARR